MTATMMVQPMASPIGSRLASAGRVDMEDPVTGMRVVLATPAGDGALWRRFLAGARSVYEAHGVGVALDHDAVIGGADTTVFFAVVDERGVCRGGLRVQGPYRRVEETHAIEEWAGSPGREDLVRAVEERIGDGVVEVKTAWVDPAIADPATADLLARLALPILVVTGARHLMATSAEHSLRRWSSSGGRIDETVCAAAYPDERYRTRVMWWDLATLEHTAGPETIATMWDGVDRIAHGLGVGALAA